jgi:CHAD domain-containing protein
MKPDPIPLGGVAAAEELSGLVVQTRMREVHRLAPGLLRRERQGLHDFRIACKRLRYAFERFEALEPTLATMTPSLARLQDALGEAHDRDVLLAILPPTMMRTRDELESGRERFVEQAARLWMEFQAIAGLTGFE